MKQAIAITSFSRRFRTIFCTFLINLSRCVSSIVLTSITSTLMLVLGVQKKFFILVKVKNKAGYTAQDAPSTRLKLTRDRRTYGRTYGRTDTPSYRDATAHLEKLRKNELDRAQTSDTFWRSACLHVSEWSYFWCSFVMILSKKSLLCLMDLRTVIPTDEQTLS